LGNRVPELLADKEFDFFIGKAEYIRNPSEFIWARVLESGKAADSVLRFRKKNLHNNLLPIKNMLFEKRNNVMIRQYSSAFTIAFNKKIKWHGGAQDEAIYF